MAKLKFLFLLIQLSFGLYFFTLQFSQEENVQQPTVITTKTILIWNSVNRIETAYFNIGSSSFVNEKCPVNKCQIFTQREALPFREYDAVHSITMVMNMLEVEFDDSQLPEIVGYTRSRHQRYVFLNQESPMTSPLNLSIYLNYFNWTMTYKHNSDILLLYGRVKRKPSAPETDSNVKRLISETRHWNKNYAADKRRVLVWMVSHCTTDSLRETYVQELRKFIDVDIWGRCKWGNFHCPRDRHWISNPECYDYLEKGYKFYLAFENSLCDDYVSEKFFNVLARNIVPVVYGGANYSKLAPPHSYIDAMQYTPKQLALYLKQIDKDDRLYNEFFWWKEHYEVEAGIEQMVRNAFCDLCRKLHEDSTVKTYEGVATFWNHSQCFSVGSWTQPSMPISNATHNNDTKIIKWRH